MSRSLPEWVGRSPDSPIPPRVRMRIYDKWKEHCAACGRKLYPQGWDCDHIVPLIAGGEHKETNLQPLCKVPCHSDKTLGDVAVKSKVARVRKRHLGIRKKSRFPGSRDSKFKKRVDGTVVLRDA